MKHWPEIIALVLLFGIAGTMDYQDQIDSEKRARAGMVLP